MSIIKQPKRSWALLAGSTCLAIGTFAPAVEPAALLLPPQASTVVRASGEEIVPLDAPTEPPKMRKRGDDFKFPPPYSKRGKDLSVAGLWDRVTGNESDAVDEEPAPPAKLDRTPAAKLVAHAGGAHHAPATPVPPVAAAGPLPAPPPGVVPAWRWFGYGAPVPGRNPYAPAGVYAPVNPAYFFQSGATPGAIPAPLLPMHPTLPQPSTAEPPLQTSKPNAEGNIQASASDSAAAMLEPPIPYWKPNSGEALPPLSSRSSTPVYRGQAPDDAVSDALLSAVRHACTGYATRIDLTPKGDRQISLRLTLSANARADDLAARLNRLPLLADYEVEMEFVR